MEKRLLCYMNPPQPSAKWTPWTTCPAEKLEILSLSNQSGTVKRRLIDMGLTPGTCVTLVKIAPFGDPMGFRCGAMKCPCARLTLLRSPCACC